MGTFRRLLLFLRPYRRDVGISAALAAVAMLATVAIPWLTGRAVDRVSDGDSGGLVELGVAVLVAGVLRLGFTYWRRMVGGRVSLGVEYDLRERLYGHLLRLELAFFDRQQTGQLMSRATVDLQAVRFFLGYGLVFLMQSVLTILLAGVAMVIVDPLLAVISLLPVPVVVVVAYRYGRRNRPAVQEVQQRLAELTADVEENVAGVRVVKAFAAEERQRVRFDRTVGRLFTQAMISTRLQAFYTPYISFLPQLGLAAILFVGGRQVIDGGLSIGQFTAFYSYLLMLLAPMRQLGMTLGLAQRATASGRRIFQVLDREPAIVAPEHPRALPADGGGHVALRDVTLQYEGTQEPAVAHVDLDVPAGRIVALIGATGSGKTALVQLLPRLYDPTSGSVEIDGIDVRELDPAALRREIAIVNDDPFLFSDTIGANIAYGRSDATRAEIEEAARRAQAAEFIAQLPEGYDTPVGERGLTLSGGQRQRLAIARAFLADPRVLVLDDATSAVDATTEQAIKASLREVMAGRTTFVIAHRLSTISLAEEIVVLEHGHVAARGTHEELLEASELYREVVAKGAPDLSELADEAAGREPGVAA